MAGKEVLTEQSTWRCLLSGANDHNNNSIVEVRWFPSTNMTEFTQVQISRGLVWAAATGPASRWLEDYESAVAIHFSHCGKEGHPTKPKLSHL
jgi:hypothetical protein